MCMYMYCFLRENTIKMEKGEVKGKENKRKKGKKRKKIRKEKNGVNTAIERGRGMM